MAEVVRDKRMSVSQRALFSAITEFEKYPEFLNEVTGAKIIKRPSPDKVHVQFEIEVVKKFVYTLEFKLKNNSEVAWKLVESDFFKKNEGRWLLSADGDSKTAVNYELDVDVVFLVPGWIAKKLTETNLPKMFTSFESHAKTFT